MSLILVQSDGEYQMVRRRGRYGIERACFDSPHHLAAALKAAQEQMIAGLEQRGFQFVGPDFEIRDPEPHLTYSDVVEADPGPMGDRPDPRDREAWERWERAEKARVARKMGEQPEMIDLILVASFKKRTPRQFHTAARLAATR